jgi:hypothetical protein
LLNFILYRKKLSSVLEILLNLLFSNLLFLYLVGFSVTQIYLEPLYAEPLPIPEDTTFERHVYRGSCKIYSKCIVDCEELKEANLAYSECRGKKSTSQCQPESVAEMRSYYKFKGCISYFKFHVNN